MDYNMQQIALKIKDLMYDMDFNAKQLEIKSKVSRPVISELLNGKSHNIKLKSLIRILNALEYRLDDFFSDVNIDYEI